MNGEEEMTGGGGVAGDGEMIRDGEERAVSPPRWGSTASPFIESGRRFMTIAEAPPTFP